MAYPTGTNPQAPLLPPLLRLPSPVRRHIYLLLEVASWDDRHPNKFHLHGERPSFKEDFRCSPSSLIRTPSKSTNFHGLLLSCRAISEEVASLLYSSNEFVIHYGQQLPGKLSLDPLRALRPSSLRCLSSLKVVLNQASCHGLNEARPSCCFHVDSNNRQNEAHQGDSGLQCKVRRIGNPHCHIHQPPLLGSGFEGSEDERLAAARAVLTDWESAATHLFSNITRGRLVLSLVCDIDPSHPGALDMARAVVRPLHQLSPLTYLKKCHIRLAKDTDRRLQQLAQDTVYRACSTTSTSAPSSKPSSNRKASALISLPPELRIKILEYTDLITPWREVRWTREEGHRGYSTDMYARDTRFDDAHDDNIAHWKQYYRCYLSSGPGCFCRLSHAAFSPDCRCWSPPTDLFLICRSLCDDAQHVFFSRNGFVVLDHKVCIWDLPFNEVTLQQPSFFPRDSYPWDRFAVSEFLRSVVPQHALAYLRFLEISFPPFPPAVWPGEHHPAMEDWRALVAWLADKINAPGLTLLLEVETADREPYPELGCENTITQAQGDVIMEAYMNILRPLASLAQQHRLGRFDAKLHYPWEYTEASRSRFRTERSHMWLIREISALKEREERFVMGDKGYEAMVKDGKGRSRMGGWVLTESEYEYY